MLAAYGTLVIGFVDNMLRPLLVGKDTKMPDYIVLISTLGGMAVFGLTGFVLGPAIAALFMATWDMFAEIQQQEEEAAARNAAQNPVQPQAELLAEPVSVPAANPVDASPEQKKPATEPQTFPRTANKTLVSCTSNTAFTPFLRHLQL